MQAAIKRDGNDKLQIVHHSAVLYSNKIYFFAINDDSLKTGFVSAKGKKVIFA